MSGSSLLVLLTGLAPAYALVLTTPGPNLLVILRASLSGSGRAVAAAALGIGTGAGLAALCAMLAAMLLTREAALLDAMDIIGRVTFAALLARAGWRSIRRASQTTEAAEFASHGSPMTQFGFGVLAAISNPLTVPFFATFFLGHRETRELEIALAACGMIVLMAAGWFAALGLLLARYNARRSIGGRARWPGIAIGCALLACACAAVWPLYQQYRQSM